MTPRVEAAGTHGMTFAPYLCMTSSTKSLAFKEDLLIVPETALHVDITTPGYLYRWAE
jgi:hypothetical protein